MRLQALLPALALAAVPTFAQGVHYGLSLGVSLPQADTKDLVDSKLGFTLGGNVAIPFSGGNVLRPRLDVSSVSRSLGAGYTFSVTTAALGADYNYFVSGKANSGFYLIAGLGYASTKFSITDNYAGGYNNTVASSSKGAVALAAGFGCQCSQLLGFDLRYTTTKPDSFKNDAVNVSVTFQF